MIRWGSAAEFCCNRCGHELLDDPAEYRADAQREKNAYDCDRNEERRHVRTTPSRCDGKLLPHGREHDELQAEAGKLPRDGKHHEANEAEPGPVPAPEQADGTDQHKSRRQKECEEEPLEVRGHERREWWRPGRRLVHGLSHFRSAKYCLDQDVLQQGDDGAEARQGDEDPCDNSDKCRLCSVLGHALPRKLAVSSTLESG